MILSALLFAIVFLSESGEPVGSVNDVACLRWTSAEPERWTAVVRGPSLFADGFESGDVSAWRRPGLCP